MCLAKGLRLDDENTMVDIEVLFYHFAPALLNRFLSSVGFVILMSKTICRVQAWYSHLSDCKSRKAGERGNHTLPSISAHLGLHSG